MSDERVQIINLAKAFSHKQLGENLSFDELSVLYGKLTEGSHVTTNDPELLALLIKTVAESTNKFLGYVDNVGQVTDFYNGFLSHYFGDDEELSRKIYKDVDFKLIERIYYLLYKSSLPANSTKESLLDLIKSKLYGQQGNLTKMDFPSSMKGKSFCSDPSKEAQLKERLKELRMLRKVHKKDELAAQQRECRIDKATGPVIIDLRKRYSGSTIHINSCKEKGFGYCISAFVESTKVGFPITVDIAEDGTYEIHEHEKTPMDPTFRASLRAREERITTKPRKEIYEDVFEKTIDKLYPNSTYKQTFSSYDLDEGLGEVEYLVNNDGKETVVDGLVLGKVVYLEVK